MKALPNILIKEIISQVPILIKNIDVRETGLKILNAKRRGENIVRKLKKINGSKYDQKIQ